MAVTQYIGARYVPVFADPPAWTADRTYEPLTIVTSEGNSYTSRQYVPVGVSLTNSDYWVETGDYNAQVEAYRKEVTDYKTATDTAIEETQQSVITETEARTNQDVILGNAITQLATDTKNTTDALTETDTSLAKDIKTNADRIEAVHDTIEHKKTYHKMVYIGDSWGRGYYDGDDHLTEGLAAQLATLLGATLVNKSSDGAGMATGYTFQKQFDSLTDAEKEGVDLIVIAGGQNDFDTDSATVVTAGTALFQNVKAFLDDNPGARAVYFPYPLTKHRTFVPDSTLESIDVPGNVKQFMELPNHAQANDITTATACYRWGSVMADSATSDAYHLNASGYSYFAKQMAEFIVGGVNTFPMNYDQLEIPSTVAFQNYQANELYEVNGIATMRFVAQLAQDVTVGTVIANIPENIAPGHAFSFNPGLRDGDTLRIDVSQEESKTSSWVSLQGTQSMLNGDWITINIAYPTAL